MATKGERIAKNLATRVAKGRAGELRATELALRGSMQQALDEQASVCKTEVQRMIAEARARADEACERARAEVRKRFEPRIEAARYERGILLNKEPSPRGGGGPTAAERKDWQDHQIVTNLEMTDPGLIPLWQKYGKTFKGTAQEREEAFLQMIHDRSEEMELERQEIANRELKKLLKTEEEGYRELQERREAAARRHDAAEPISGGAPSFAFGALAPASVMGAFLPGSLRPGSFRPESLRPPIPPSGMPSSSQGRPPASAAPRSSVPGSVPTQVSAQAPASFPPFTYSAAAPTPRPSFIPEWLMPAPPSSRRPVALPAIPPPPTPPPGWPPPPAFALTMPSGAMRPPAPPVMGARREPSFAEVLAMPQWTTRDPRQGSLLPELAPPSTERGMGPLTPPPAALRTRVSGPTQATLFGAAPVDPNQFGLFGRR